jgi:uncharacterized protein YmfQ (DUF2313 family)
VDTLELLDFMTQGLAPGILENCWDFAPNPLDPDLYEEWYAIAASFKTAVTDRIDALRRERNPAQAVEKLEDFEVTLGLHFTQTAQFGTDAQRQGQLVGRFRESLPLTIAGIQTIMQPYLLYADPTQIQVIEPNRAAQKAAHTYAFPSAVSIPFGTAVTITANVTDDSFVSDMGAQLFINLQVAGSAASGFITLTGPDDFSVGFDMGDYLSLGVPSGMNTVFDLVLYAPQFAPQLNADKTGYNRRQIKGLWKLTVRNMDVINTASVFVEGVGRNAAGQDGLGAAMFEWGVLAEHAKMGAGADLAGAAAAIQRINHAHLIGDLILDPEGVNVTPMIPDDPNAIPNEGIPG